MALPAVAAIGVMDCVDMLAEAGCVEGRWGCLNRSRCAFASIITIARWATRQSSMMGT